MFMPCLKAWLLATATLPTEFRHQSASTSHLVWPSSRYSRHELLHMTQPHCTTSRMAASNPTTLLCDTAHRVRRDSGFQPMKPTKPTISCCCSCDLFLQCLFLPETMLTQPYRGRTGIKRLQSPLLALGAQQPIASTHVARAAMATTHVNRLAGGQLGCAR